MVKMRNNDYFIKKSLEKTSSRLEETNKIINKQSIELVEKYLAEKQLLEQLKKIDMILENLEEMSYNDLRKHASDVGINIYQRKKEDLKEEIRNYYEQLRSETH